MKYINILLLIILCGCASFKPPQPHVYYDSLENKYLMISDYHPSRENNPDAVNILETNLSTVPIFIPIMFVVLTSFLLLITNQYSFN